MKWNQVPLGYCVTEVKEKNVGGREENLLSLSYGRIVRRDIATADGLLPESFDSYNIILPGDTVLRLTDLQNDQRSLRVGLVDERGIITSAYVTIRPNKDVDPKFLNYFLKHTDFRKEFYALGAGVRQSLKFEELRSIKVSVPPIAEQKAIVDYLDRETLQLESIIAKKEQLLALLNEYREALVPQFLAGDQVGSSNIDTEPYENLPEEYCPISAPTAVRLREGWCWSRFGSVVRHIDERTNDGEGTLLSVSKIHGVVPRNQITDKLPRAESLIGYKKCLAGDFIVNQMSVYDGLMGVAPCDGIVTYHYLVFRPTKDINLDFIQLVLTSENYKQDFSRRVRGLGDSSQGQVRTPHIRIADMLQTVIPLPTLDQQVGIVLAISGITERCKEGVARIQTQVQLLRERRQALISSAVIGELEIPEIAA